MGAGPVRVRPAGWSDGLEQADQAGFHFAFDFHGDAPWISVEVLASGDRAPGLGKSITSGRARFCGGLPAGPCGIHIAPYRATRFPLFKSQAWAPPETEYRFRRRPGFRTGASSTRRTRSGRLRRPLSRAKKNPRRAEYTLRGLLV